MGGGLDDRSQSRRIGAAADAPLRGRRRRAFSRPNRLGALLRPLAPEGQALRAPAPASLHRLRRCPRAPPASALRAQASGPAPTVAVVSAAALVRAAAPAPSRLRASIGASTGLAREPVGAMPRLALEVFVDSSKLVDVVREDLLVARLPRLGMLRERGHALLELPVRLLAPPLAAVVALARKVLVFPVEELGEGDAERAREDAARGRQTGRSAEEPRHEDAKEGVLRPPFVGRETARNRPFVGREATRNRPFVGRETVRNRPFVGREVIRNRLVRM